MGRGCRLWHLTLWLSHLRIRGHNMAWIGVDLDGTLAYWDYNRGPDHVGEPIPKMLARVRKWLDEGFEIRIVTARVGPDHPDHVGYGDKSRIAIDAWCLKHLGRTIPVICYK